MAVNLQTSWTLPPEADPVRRGLFVGCDYLGSTIMPDGGQTSLDTKGFFGSDTLKLYSSMTFYPHNKPIPGQEYIHAQYACALIETGELPDANEFSKAAFEQIFQRPKHLRGRPSKTNILQALAALAAVTRPKDVAYFHFCGHGSGGPGSLTARFMSLLSGVPIESFLVCSSEDPMEPNEVTMLSHTELQQVFSQFAPGANLTITIDACYSRDMIPAMAPSRGLLITATTDAGLTLYNAALDKKQYTYSFSVMLASLDTDDKAVPRDTRTCVDVVHQLQNMSDVVAGKAKMPIKVQMRDPEGVQAKKFLGFPG